MHPALRIVALLIWALTIYQLSSHAMPWLLACVVLLLAVFDRWRVLYGIRNMDVDSTSSNFPSVIEWLRLMYRMRWILLMLVLVFVFNTPGEYIPLGSLPWMPSYEGLRAATEQCMRLSLVLAGMALLWTTTAKDSLMFALYTLAKPWVFLGANPERFAVRLWLTLYYVERERQDGKKSLKKLLEADGLIAEHVPEPVEIKLTVVKMEWFDFLWLFAMLCWGFWLVCA